MGLGDPGPGVSRSAGPQQALREPESSPSLAASRSSWIIETEVSPFHCLYQDALFFHSQSRLAKARSEAESSRYARASLLCYVGAAEALVHQAAVELARPELAAIAGNPQRPLPLEEVWRILPALLADRPLNGGGGSFDTPPWPQFAELLALRNSWAYPGHASTRRAFYRAPSQTADYEPLQPHQAPPELKIPLDRLAFTRTGLPRDPYALRPDHLDTARGVLDAAIDALDRRVGGELTRDNRHRREPVRVVHKPDGKPG